jgi:hypothetical protein
MPPFSALNFPTMKFPSTLGPADRHRLDDLVRRSNAGLCGAMIRFVDADHRHIGESLRNDWPPDLAVHRFLDELPSMQDYRGTSYRVSWITRNGLAALLEPDSVGRPFADRGAQCAFVLPSHAAAWARHRLAAPACVGAVPLFSIFDESVPQKNLSTALLVDCVVVPPGTPLRLKTLRLVAGKAATGLHRAHVVAQFASAGLSCGAPRDLYSGAPRD